MVRQVLSEALRLGDNVGIPNAMISSALLQAT